MPVTINGRTLDIAPGGSPSGLYVESGTLAPKNSIGQRSTCDFTVADAAGSEHYEQGNPVVVTDDSSGAVVFAGQVVSDTETQPAQGALLEHALACADWHVLADKRRFPYSNTNVTAGQILSDMLSQVLAAEGVYAVKNLLSANQSDVETDTTGFTAISSATLTRDTGAFWHGAAALKVVTPGAVVGEGAAAFLPAASYQSNEIITASVYVKGSGTVQLLVTQQGVATILTGPVITLTGAWTRYSVTGAMPSGTLSGNYGIRVATTGASPQAITFWMDGLQIEPSPLGPLVPLFPVSNLYSANQADVESDFVTGSGGGSLFLQGTGVTISRDGTQAWHGSSSLKCVSDGTGTFQSMSVNIPASLFVPGATYTFSAYMKASAGTPSVRVFCEGNDQITGNTSIGTVQSVTLSTSWQRYAVTVTLPSPLANGGTAFSYIGLRIDTGSPAQAITWWMDALQIQAGNALTDWVAGSSGAATTMLGGSVWELGGTSSIQAGPTITEFTSNYETCAACLDALAQAASTFVWQIDAMKRLWFGAQGQQTAPWSATAADMERDSIQVERANPLYRNRQFLLGGTDVTSQQTEQRKGDGSATAFTFSYPFASVPTVTVNGVSKTVGIKGVDTGRDWYWSKGDAVLAQDTGGTRLVSTDTLQAVYFGQFPIVIQSDDSSEQTAEQGREGGVGSGTGLVEDVQTDSTLSSSAAGFQVAAGFLARYSQLGKQLTFTTRRSGLAQGQLLTVDLTGTSHDIGPGEQMLIESVSAQHDGLQWWYTVKALEGPINTTWVQFFTALAGKAAASVDKINLGASGTLVILASATAAVSLAVTGHVTITTYALPSPTSYPSPTTYPGSTGAPVALTWTKTQAGLNLLRDVLAGAAADDRVRYLAWGTGTQGTPSTATQLAAEAGRKAITKYTDGASVGEIIIDGVMGPTDGAGVAITEVGLFAGPAAGSGANSGVMLLYGAYAHTHTNTENLDIQADLTFS